MNIQRIPSLPEAIARDQRDRLMKEAANARLLSQLKKSTSQRKGEVRQRVRLALKRHALPIGILMALAVLVSVNIGW